MIFITLFALTYLLLAGQIILVMAGAVKPLAMAVNLAAVLISTLALVKHIERTK